MTAVRPVSKPRRQAVRGLRQQLEDAVEQAIAALDTIDLDDDLEDGDDDEPSLCGVSVGRGIPLDLEDACEDEGAEHDGREASLCGITFGVGDPLHLDREATSPAFTMDHRELETAR